MPKEYRIDYVDRRGAHCMRTVTPETAEAELGKLYRRSIEADLYEYINGERQEYLQGAVCPHPDGGLTWFIDNDWP